MSALCVSPQAIADRIPMSMSSRVSPPDGLAAGSNMERISDTALEYCGRSERQSELVMNSEAPHVFIRQVLCIEHDDAPNRWRSILGLTFSDRVMLSE